MSRFGLILLIIKVPFCLRVSARRRGLKISFCLRARSTRTISEVFREKLYKLYTVNMLQVGPNPNYQILSDYDFLLFGFPTYHGKPSTSMMEYVDNMPRFEAHQMAFVFTTCGLYTGNSLRILITKLWEKNIITTGYLQIRGPARAVWNVCRIAPSKRLFFQKR